MRVFGGLEVKHFLSRPLLVLVGMTAVAIAGCTAINLGPTPTPRPATESSRLAPLTPAPGVTGNPESGRQIFIASGCSGCHTYPAVPGASGIIGPNLNNITLRPTLAGGALPNTPDNLVRWIRDAPSIKQGTVMPKFDSFTEQQVRDLAAFLYSQPYNSR